MEPSFAALLLFLSAGSLVTSAWALCVIAGRLREICGFLWTMNQDPMPRKPKSPWEDDGEGWKQN